jgi:hypothetical protein
MLNPRIYRAAFLPVIVAVVALAFSFENEPSPLGTTLAPVAFNGGAAWGVLQNLATTYPNRSPGSATDGSLATAVAGYLRTAGAPHPTFNVSSQTYDAQTAVGARPVETVIAEQPGYSNGRIVVIAHRDGLGSGAASGPAPAAPCLSAAYRPQAQCAALSSTATLIELARVLSGRTLDRTLDLISTSGSVGLADATHLAASLGGPIDAVIVLGDAAGTRTSEPALVPWSSGENVAPLLLRTTVGAALQAEAGVAPGDVGVPAQFARLAFPVTLSEQGPFVAAGIPAVLMSRGGESGPAAGAAVSQRQLTGFGQAALQVVSALDSGAGIPPPSTYLVFKGMSVPEWPIQLLVFTLILPVLCAAVDGFARARRRGHRVGRWAAWVLAAALPFALACLFIRFIGALGLVRVLPPGPMLGGAIHLHLRELVQLAAVVLIIVLAMLPLRSLLVRRAGVEGDPGEAGAAAAVLLVLCAITLAIWVTNPFAAALIVPALHVWMWVVAPEVRLRAPVALAAVLVGLAPIALVILYYADQFQLGPGGVAWTGVLLIANGAIPIPTLIEWSVVAGCAVSVAVIAARGTRAAAAPESSRITIRGPVTYAGPGSLGGTKSALRR